MRKSKIKTREELVKIVHKLKRKGKKIATYNGSFDILHAGHIRALKEAKDQGDVLVVALNSDKSIRSYKGPKRPIVPENERAEILAALEVVDYVVLFDEISCREILREIKPDIHCKSPDWGKDCIERATVEQNGGKIHLLKWHEGKSTSDLINRIIEVYNELVVKAVFMDRDGTINDNREGYIHKISDFEFLPGVIEGLKKLSKSSYKIIVVSNQSGIGRGMYNEEDFHKLNDWMLSYLRKQGIRIDTVYFCPHSPDDNCSCRKPKIGLFLKAASDLKLSLSESWVLGDDDRDIIAGREINAKTIKLGAKIAKDLKLGPHFYAKNLQEAVDIILRKG